jgi:hypothetical protein
MSSADARDNSARLASALPSLRTTGSGDMAQRSIEILIGRLVTDESFRRAFRTSPGSSLIGFVESGYDLTAVEIAAVRATPVELWEQAAERIDARLQKASFDVDSSRAGRESTRNAAPKEER